VNFSTLIRVSIVRPSPRGTAATAPDAPTTPWFHSSTYRCLKRLQRSERPWRAASVSIAPKRTASWLRQD